MGKGKHLIRRGTFQVKEKKRVGDSSFYFCSVPFLGFYGKVRVFFFGRLFRCSRSWVDSPSDSRSLLLLSLFFSAPFFALSTSTTMGYAERLVTRDSLHTKENKTCVVSSPPPSLIQNPRNQISF